MCGFAGFFDLQAQTPPFMAQAVARRMIATLDHRGPDAEGMWVDAAAGIALAHRRLAIVDLSPAGRQPMADADGRFVVSYNGEIYNWRELRAELEGLGRRFRSSSDTEVLVEGCAVWGVEATVRRLNGIFAAAIWDVEERRLWLVRDPLGVKPLFYGRFGAVWLFASQPKALQPHPAFDGELDRDALTAYLRYAYVPAPYSAFRHVRKLPPGGLLRLDPDGGETLTIYWDALEMATRAAADPLDLSDDEAADRLEALLRDAVGRQMVADAPLGAFLSGGIDSATVAAQMQAQSDRPVQTFTIGFGDGDYDESAAAEAVARHLGTEHTTLRAEPADALELVDRLHDWFDEPFADASQLPTLLLSRLTRGHVTVALSGDGGDELFAGYNRYLWGARLWQECGGWPAGMRRAVSRGLAGFSPASVDRAFSLLPARLRPRQAGLKLQKLAYGIGACSSPDALYRRLVGQWNGPARLVPGATEPEPAHSDAAYAAAAPDVVERMQLRDLTTYLPDDVLAKVDRASMAYGLEARVPLLDLRLVEFAWRLPLRFKLRDGTSKWLLRRVLARHVPPALFERPKSGFAVPIADWLRGPLRDWAEDLLDPQAMAHDGLPAPGPVRALWAQHLAGKTDGSGPLWTALSLLAWRRRRREKQEPAAWEQTP
jgi:asparagine synthase (glutamine-hydrolysing)